MEQIIVGLLSGNFRRRCCFGACIGSGVDGQITLGMFWVSLGYLGRLSTTIGHFAAGFGLPWGD